jgi:glycerol-3-phosphate dehydrogenase
MADYDLLSSAGFERRQHRARRAGRGLRVILLEQGDLGASVHPGLAAAIHGDLSVLERRAFFRERR